VVDAPPHGFLRVCAGILSVDLVGDQLLRNWHIDAIAHALTKLCAGRPVADHHRAAPIVEIDLRFQAFPAFVLDMIQPAASSA
jgi:hypothetical protein